jgi:hypothetical protein
MGAFWEKKVKIVELQQFRSLGGGGVKCHFLNIGVKSGNEWIVQGGKMYFSLLSINVGSICHNKFLASLSRIV